MSPQIVIARVVLVGALCTAGCDSLTDEDCKRIPGTAGFGPGSYQFSTCVLNGRCTASDEGCVAGSDADCQRTWPCWHYDECAAENGECVKRVRTDCPQSSACKREQKCTPVMGVCGFTKKQCQESPSCKKLGKCFPYIAGCEAVADEFCKAAWICQEEGKCGIERIGPGLPLPGCIVIDEDDCRASNICARDGQCTFNYGICRAVSDADCVGSAACKTHGRCKASDGACVK